MVAGGVQLIATFKDGLLTISKQAVSVNTVDTVKFYKLPPLAILQFFERQR